MLTFNQRKFLVTLNNKVPNAVRSAIDRLFIVLIIIVVIVAALAVAFYASMDGRASSSSSIITSKTASNSSPLSFLGNLGDMIGNFSQMKVSFGITSFFSSTSTSGSISTNGTMGYDVLRNVTNGTSKLTEVNFTSDETSDGVTTNSFFLIYYSSTWNVTLVNFRDRNYTGSQAESFAASATQYFTFTFATQEQYLENATAFNQLTLKSTTDTMAFGNVKMSVTTYAGTVANEGGSTSNLEIRLGTVSGESFSVLTYVNGAVSGAEGNETYEYQLISATQAPS